VCLSIKVKRLCRHLSLIQYHIVGYVRVRVRVRDRDRVRD